MPELLHIRTLFFVGALTAVLCAAMLLVLRRLHRRSETAMLWGALGLVCSGLAMMCVAMRGLIPDLASWAGANTLGPAGMFVLYEAVRRLCRVKPWPLFPAVATVLMLVFQLWLGAAPEDHATRLTASSLAAATTAALMLPLLLRRIGRDPAGPVAGAIALALVLLVAHGARALSIMMEGISLSADSQQATGPLHTLAALMFVLGPMIQAMVVLSWVNGRVAAELRTMASTDELTGLASRRSFFSLARQRLERGIPGSRVAAMLMIDLDEFKQINDRYGHRAGDRALAHFAGTLRRTLSPNDLAGRYGGEEFCALLVRDGEEEVIRTAEAIRAAVLARSFEYEGAGIPLSVSIGVSTMLGQQDFEGLLATADRRVYLAKSLGRNRVIASEADLQHDRRQGRDRRRGPAQALPADPQTAFQPTIAASSDAASGAA